MKLLSSIGRLASRISFLQKLKNGREMMITSSMEIFSQIRSENSSHEPSAQCACFDILNKTGFW